MTNERENEIKLAVQNEFGRLIEAIEETMRYEVAVVRNGKAVKKVFRESSKAYICYNNNLPDSEVVNVTAITGPVEYGGKLREGRELIFAKELHGEAIQNIHGDFEPVELLKKRISEELLRKYVKKTFSISEEQQKALDDASDVSKAAF